MRCFGISNTPPDRVISLLQSKGIADNVTVLPVGSELPKKAKHLALLSISDFMRNQVKLNQPEYENTAIYVFASPLRLVELSGCTRLDFEYAPGTGRSSFVYRPFDVAAIKKRLKADPTPAKRKTSEYLFELIERSTVGSLLTPLMTLIYTLNASSDQGPVKELAAKHLVTGAQKPKQLADLRASALKHMTEAKADRFMKLMTDPVVEHFQAAFHAHLKEGVNAKKACKDNAIPEYEFRYLLSVHTAARDFKPIRNKNLRDITRQGLRPATKRLETQAANKAAKTSKAKK